MTLIYGIQGGYMKYAGFLCLWDSRADEKHYNKQEWPSRPSFDPGSHNVIYKPIISCTKILLPPVHKKLGLMRSFIRALKKDRQAFFFWQENFQRLVMPN